VCTATVALAGTFTAAATLDPAGGCQPAGTWAVTTSVSDMGTCTTVPVKASYSYTVSGTGRDTLLTYTKDTGEDFTGAVEATGGGGCEGSFDHVVADAGKFDEANLHPQLANPTAGGTTLTITGTGTYNLWSAHP